MSHILHNLHLTVAISEHGAELTSIINNETGEEYLWQADPAYWKRHAPVLFPIVGSVWDGQYRQDGKTYKMSQHGFARDMDFHLLHKTDGEIVYQLRSNKETLEKYPYEFILTIGYKLDGWNIDVLWTIENPGTTPIHFQIGAHPAFNYKDFDPIAPVQGYFTFSDSNGTSINKLQRSTIGEKGCIAPGLTEMPLEKGLMPITPNTFNQDALVFENSQLQQVDLLDAQKAPYLRLKFDAPVVGLWSPCKDSYAPFVCIEPWYGRCDRMNYDGEFKDKDWMRHLDGGRTYHKSYSIEIL